MKKSNKRSIFDNKRVMLVFSLVTAILAWIIVAGFIDPGADREIANVRIDYREKEADYIAKGLQIVGDYPAVNGEVKVSGDGSVISPLNNADVRIYADYSAVNDAGVHVVPLRAERVAPGNYNIIDYSIKTTENSLRRNAEQSVTITFEKVATATKEIEVRSDGLVAAEGFYKDMPPLLSVQEVVITGPESAVNRVSKVEAVVPDEGERRDTAIYSLPLVLLDEAGSTLSATDLGLTLSTENVEVTIRILEIRSIKLDIGFTGLTPGFDTAWLRERFTLDHDTLQVAGTTEALNSLGETLTIGSIDVSTLSLDWEPQPFDIVLPGEENGLLRNYDQRTQVMVSFSHEGLVQKDFDVENITIANKPQGVDIKPLLEVIPNVTLLGPADQLDGVLPEGITVEIDAFGVTMANSGQQTIPARVLIPGANHVFAIGDYKQVCDVTVETADASASSQTAGS